MLALALTHLPPLWTVSPALLAWAVIVWYWLRLGRADVPSSRRKIRRTSLMFLSITLLMGVRGLSFVDRQTQPREYIITWMMALLMVLIVMAVAGLDAMNNLRLLQRQAHKAVQDSARELVAAIHRRRESPAISFRDQLPDKLDEQDDLA